MKKEYLEKIVELINKGLPEGSTARLQECEKVNHKEIGIIIETTGTNIMPLFYVNSHAAEDIPSEAERILKEYQKLLKEKPADNAVSALLAMTWEDASKNIRRKLISISDNEEYLRDKPHGHFLDLAVVYYLTVDLKGETGSVMITDSILNLLHAGKKQLFSLPSNDEYHISNIMDIIAEHMGIDKENSSLFPFDNEMNMYVLSNTSMQFGAAGILDDALLRGFCKDQEFCVARHSYASILAAGGVDPKMLQSLLGHRDISTTLNIYTHVNADMLEKQTDKIEASLSF